MVDLLLLREDRGCERTSVGVDFVDSPLVIAGLDLVSTSPWQDFPEIRLRLDGPPRDYFTCGALGLCSPALQMCFEGEPVEFFPVEWEGRFAGSAAGYKAIHFLADAEVVDRSTSSIEFHRDGWVRRVNSIALRPDVNPPANVFVEARSYVSLVFVTGQFGVEISRFSGLEAIEVEAFRDGMWRR